MCETVNATGIFHFDFPGCRVLIGPTATLASCMLQVLVGVADVPNRTGIVCGHRWWCEGVKGKHLHFLEILSQFFLPSLHQPFESCGGTEGRQARNGTCKIDATLVIWLLPEPLAVPLYDIVKDRGRKRERERVTKSTGFRVRNAQPE